MAIAPTLLVGIGGQGTKILTKISKKLGSDHSKRIQMVTLDTDANELRDAAEAVPGMKWVQTSPNMTVGAALRKNAFARDTWFPLNKILEGKSMTEGAGQVRAISRLAFEQTIINGNMKPVHDAIDDLKLLGADSFSQGLRVVICGSIAGGTGSGLSLPLALYLRNYLTTQCNISSLNIRGFFLLGDIIGRTVLSDNSAQQANLRTNTYAALREIDAFAGRADGDDLSDYAAVEFDIPAEASAERSFYPPILPYDTVFLMDYNNKNGNGLSGIDAYLEYAADTIFALAISPISRQSNSSEDNEVLRIANIADNGHCRYAAAGSAEINYPMDIIAEYVALNWAKESIGKEWTDIDKAIDVKERIAKRNGDQFDKADAFIKEFDKRINSTVVSAFYKRLDAQVKNNFSADGQATDIEDENFILIDGNSSDFSPFGEYDDEEDFEDEDEDEDYEDEEDFEEVSTKVDIQEISVKGRIDARYINAIFKCAKDNLENDRKYNDASIDFLDALDRLGQASYADAAQVLNGFLNEAETFANKITKIIPDISRGIARQIFSLSPEGAIDKEPSEEDFEFHLKSKDDKGGIIHPIAARYVAYSTKQKVLLLLEQVEVVDKDLSEAISNTFRQKKEWHKDILNAENQISKPGVIAAFASRIGKALGSGKDTSALDTYVRGVLTNPQNLGEMLRSRVYVQLLKAVLVEAKSYLEDLIRSYEEFFTFIDSEIRTIAIKIQGIENNKLYNAHNIEENGLMGSSTRYICADRDSLANILSTCQRPSSSADLDPKVSSEIFAAIKAMAEHKRREDRMYGKNTDDMEVTTMADRRAKKAAEEGQRKQFFEKAFENSIIGYWKKEVITGQYSAEIDIDIIQAIRKEAVYRGCIGNHDIEEYVKGVIRSGEGLSEVFLQVPNPDRLKIMMYDKDIRDPYDPGKEACLQDKSTFSGSIVAAKDPNLTRQQILFFQSCYGIALKNVPQFMAPKDVSRDDYKAIDGTQRGVYYTAYYDRIRELSDNLNQGSYVSPHMDARWHLSFEFPDLDPNEGRRQRYNVIRSFVYGTLFKKIVSRPDTGGSGLIYFSVIDGERNSLEVRDRRCDEFHEIFEACMINNKLVYNLLEDCVKTREEDGNNASLSESSLAKNLTSDALKINGTDVTIEEFLEIVENTWKTKLSSKLVGTKDEGNLCLQLLEVKTEKLPNVRTINSIYELPLFYEMTKPASARHDFVVIEMIESIHEIIFNYLKHLVNEADLYNRAVLFFIEQYRRLLFTIDETLAELKSNIKYDTKTLTLVNDKLDYWIRQNSPDIRNDLVKGWRDVVKRDEKRDD